MNVSIFELPWFERTRRLNLIPFYYDYEIVRFHIKEVAANVLVFIPIGLYLKIFEISNRKTVFIGFIFSFCLELIQFVTTIGACDITDIITNTMGTAIGICVYLLAVKLFSDKAKAVRRINILVSVVIFCVLTVAVILFIAN